MDTVQRLYMTPRARVEKEIKQHIEWCKNCKSVFSPAKYRKLRIDHKLSRLEVQNNKVYCHD